MINSHASITNLRLTSAHPTQIPDSVAFWILTSFVRLPIQCYLILAEHTAIGTVSLIVQTAAMTFIILQIFIGFFVIRVLSETRAKQFRLETLIKQQNSVSTTAVPSSNQ